MKKVTRKGSVGGAPAVIISLIRKSFPLAFLSCSSLIPFEISSIVDEEWRIESCLLSGRILLLPSNLFFPLSLTLNKLKKYSTHFNGGIESIWLELLFVFPLTFLICQQNSLGSLDTFSNILIFSIFHFWWIFLMVCLYFLFILLYWHRVWGFFGNF